MNDLELLNAWKTYDKKLDKILEVNQQQVREIQQIKAESKIRSFVRNHTIVMIIGILYIAILSWLVYHTRDNIYFTLSVSGIIIFNIFAVLGYLRHIIILGSIDLARNLTETQRKLSLVTTSYINVGRILFLQTPFYCTWWYRQELIDNAGTGFWIVQAVIVVSLTTLAIYLFIKLSPNNRSDHWAKRVDRWFGAEKLLEARNFLDKIVDFEKEKTS